MIHKKKKKLVPCHRSPELHVGASMEKPAVADTGTVQCSWYCLLLRLALALFSAALEHGQS